MRYSFAIIKMQPPILIDHGLVFLSLRFYLELNHEPIDKPTIVNLL